MRWPRKFCGHGWVLYQRQKYDAELNTMCVVWWSGLASVSNLRLAQGELKVCSRLSSTSMKQHVEKQKKENLLQKTLRFKICLSIVWQISARNPKSRLFHPNQSCSYQKYVQNAPILRPWLTLFYNFADVRILHILLGFAGVAYWAGARLATPRSRFDFNLVLRVHYTLRFFHHHKSSS